MNKEAKPIMDKETKQTYIIFSLVILLILAGGSYGYYILNERLIVLGNNLIKLDNKLDRISTELNDKTDNLNGMINDVSKSLSEKSKTLENNIDKVKEENDKSAMALSNLIKEVEQQSNIELEKVKKDIQSVGVVAGDFSQIVQGVLPSVVSIITDKGRGSGAFISNDGYIVTNNHVIDEANQINVYTYDKKLFGAVIIGADKEFDIAVLKVNATYIPIELDDSTQVKVGEKVIALGNPGGLDFTVTEGIVSATDRKISSTLPGYIQIDVALNPGNSGGPLVNTRGKLIGINNFKVSGEYEALGFAIPSNVVKESINRII